MTFSEITAELFLIYNDEIDSTLMKIGHQRIPLLKGQLCRPLKFS